MKAAHFHPLALADIQGYSKEVRRKLGKAIYDIQEGHMPSMPLSRPMPEVWPGAAELRIRDSAGIYRVFYVVPDVVLIAHAFVKKTEKTPPHEIQVARNRIKQMLKG